MTAQQLTTAPAQGQLQQAFGAFSPAVLVEQVQLIQQAMKDVMFEGEHFGVIPGTERKNKDGKDVSKRCLLKPGAEKLGFLFRLAPAYEITTTELPRDHREYRVVCRLESIQSGAFVGSGVGICSTMESKYRWRGGARKCPACGSEAIKRSKYPPRNNPQAEPGFYCYAKVGGCGAEFAADDRAITDQSESRSENPDIADTYNTVLKMAKKRAHVDAILTATAASDIFTQDLDDDEPAPPISQAQPPTQMQKPANGAAPPQQKPAAPAPMTWQKLGARIDATDAELSGKGWNPVGIYAQELMHRATTQHGLPADMSRWNTADIVTMTAEAVKLKKEIVNRVEREEAAQRERQEQPPATETPPTDGPGLVVLLRDFAEEWKDHFSPGALLLYFQQRGSLARFPPLVQDWTPKQVEKALPWVEECRQIVAERLAGQAAA